MMMGQKQLLWVVVALVSYLIASVAFLAVLFGAGLLGPDFSPEALSAADMAWILASVALFALGGYATYQVRRSTRPEPSPLPSQFQHGPGPSRPQTDSPVDSPPVDPSASFDTVRCPECGTENDPQFTFCRNCSAKLSD